MLRRLMRPAFGLCPHEEGRRKGRQPGRSDEEAGGAPGLCLTEGVLICTWITSNYCQTKKAFGDGKRADCMESSQFA